MGFVKPKKLKNKREKAEKFLEKYLPSLDKSAGHFQDVLKELLELIGEKK